MGAKATTLSAAIPGAEATGLLDLRPNSLAFEITLGKHGYARSVRYLDQETRREREVFARHIVVAGNAIGTPHLLQRAGARLRGARDPQGDRRPSSERP
jgi:choline dehydrogenase-like flavoprotein